MVHVLRLPRRLQGARSGTRPSSPGKRRRRPCALAWAQITDPDAMTAGSARTPVDTYTWKSLIQGFLFAGVRRRKIREYVRYTGVRRMRAQGMAMRAATCELFRGHRQSSLRYSPGDNLPAASVVNHSLGRVDGPLNRSDGQVDTAARRARAGVSHVEMPGQRSASLSLEPSCAPVRLPRVLAPVVDTRARRYTRPKPRAAAGVRELAEIRPHVRARRFLGERSPGWSTAAQVGRGSI